MMMIEITRTPPIGSSKMGDTVTFSKVPKRRECQIGRALGGLVGWVSQGSKILVEVGEDHMVGFG